MGERADAGERADSGRPDADDAVHGHGHHHKLNELGYRGHRFDDAEKWSARFDAPQRDAWQRPDQVIDALELQADARVADLGAGTGYFAVRLAGAVPEGQVYAVDIEPSMVQFLDERAESGGLDNMRGVLGGPNSAALPEPVDLALMCDVLHHLDDPGGYFAGLRSSLRPNARVVIIDFKKDNPDDAPGPPKAARLDAGAVVEMLDAAGYALVSEDRDLLEFQYMLVFRAR